MRILMLSSLDQEGGAARSAYRLHKSLLEAGADSRMLVQQKDGDDPEVAGPADDRGKLAAKIRPKLDALPVKLLYRPDQSSLFSPAWLPDSLPRKVRGIKPDIVNLHWINRGFIRIENLRRLPGPLVWTLHDMWSLTGGCHYDAECGRYREACGRCPQLRSDRERDLSRSIYARKRRYWKNLPLTIVSPSRWLGDCARSSSLFQGTRVEVIPNGIDLARFRPVDKGVARDLLGLPRDKGLILFGAMSTSDKRKGLAHLQNAMRVLASEGLASRVDLVLFGAGRSGRDLGFRVHQAGRLHDDVSLALLYAACDIFVAPSLQDNLPNTVMEAMACGTPCVAFRIGGMPDMVDHGRNGYLARPFDPGDLAEGIRGLMTDEARRTAFGEAARRRCERDFSASRTAEAYLSLYAELQDSRKSA